VATIGTEEADLVRPAIGHNNAAVQQLKRSTNTVEFIGHFTVQSADTQYGLAYHAPFVCLCNSALNDARAGAIADLAVRLS
jgi:hypothetical protein